jgi:hypothetical protein
MAIISANLIAVRAKRQIGDGQETSVTTAIDNAIEGLDYDRKDISDEVYEEITKQVTEYQEKLSADQLEEQKTNTTVEPTVTETEATEPATTRRTRNNANTQS